MRVPIGLVTEQCNTATAVLVIDLLQQCANRRQLRAQLVQILPLRLHQTHPAPVRRQGDLVHVDPDLVQLALDFRERLCVLATELEKPLPDPDHRPQGIGSAAIAKLRHHRVEGPKFFSGDARTQDSPARGGRIICGIPLTFVRRTSNCRPFSGAIGGH